MTADPIRTRRIPSGRVQGRMANHECGRTAGGTPIADESIHELVARVQAGYDVEEALRRRVGQGAYGRVGR
jgi:hypothetical protein